MFIRNESFSEFIQSYKVVTALIAVNLFFLIWTEVFPFLGGYEIYLLGVGNNAAVALGEYWRLFTPIFLHGGLMHFAFNSFSLFLFGPSLETMLGRVKFISLYLATGVIANIATFYLGDPMLLHLGASGAIFGLFGLYLYIVLMRKELLPQASQQIILTIIVIGVIMTFVNPGINILAHLFGLISGLAVAPLFLSRVNRVSRYQRAHEPDEIGFDPQRWAKRKQHRERMWLYIIGGIAAMISFFWLVDFLFLSRLW
ncbi:rhomboid family intramembrane serine protease [Salisediminibacterium halotolerans]|uniref:Membrane associated serine protease, rhomboid family n=1 Tax=Salisediminibacterium halotolerans TaxID=517425 RepID=A0A1H9SNU9_9BACI|nr:rhomboid family intramembrane serine protease [Salisediminibacterium haloalkalitolerans]SER86690.1 Membrane associated serine protease, rhomboid family [Salisediminibacterium haloalkalitolerans]